MDWWQIALGLSLIGLFSVICGMIAGIPLSRLVLRHRNQTSIDEHRMSSGFEPLYQYTIDQLDDLLKKYTASDPKTEENGIEVTYKRENGETEVGAEQVEPNVIDRLLLELGGNRKLSIEPTSDELLPFQTNTWDTNHDALDMVQADLKWELKRAYLDMSIANSIIRFLSEFDRKSPVLDNQYVKMCNQIADRLSRIIPKLETAKNIAT